ncbi:MAG: PqqD family protein [Clostridia bacterium]|nr:PqqD family protein [Clostridia bacterium]
MKIKDGFILREVAGNYIVVAVGEAVKSFNGVINLNETGAFLWKILQTGGDEQSLITALLSEYEVSEEIAKRDVQTFITKLTEAGLIK